MTFHLTIATLDKILLQDDVTAIYLPTSKGEIGVLTNHTTYLTNTLPGQIRSINANNETITVDIIRPGVVFFKVNQARLWVC